MQPEQIGEYFHQKLTIGEFEADEKEQKRKLVKNAAAKEAYGSFLPYAKMSVDECRMLLLRKVFQVPPLDLIRSCFTLKFDFDRL